MATNECCAFNAATRCSCKKFNTSLIWKAQRLSLLHPRNTHCSELLHYAKTETRSGSAAAKTLSSQEETCTLKRITELHPALDSHCSLNKGSPKEAGKKTPKTQSFLQTCPINFFSDRVLLCSSGWS